MSRDAEVVTNDHAGVADLEAEKFEDDSPKMTSDFDTNIQQPLVQVVYLRCL